MRPALFLHTQKTAGTSIQHMARWAYGNDAVISHGDYTSLGVEGCKKKQFVSGHFGIEFARPLMEGRYCFTFLRDPVERLLSLYTFCSQQDSDAFPIYAAARRSDLNGFLCLAFGDDEHLRSSLWNHQVWQLAYGRHVERPRRIADFGPDELLNMAISNLALFDHVGLVETFDADARLIFEALGSENTQTQKDNVSENRPRPESLPGETRQTLLDLTELDSILYAYVKGLRSRSSTSAQAASASA